MACLKCEWKGYVETSVYRDGGIKPILEQCMHCRDTEAYSLAVQRRSEMMEQALRVAQKYDAKRRARYNPPCPVIPLRKKNDSEA